MKRLILSVALCMVSTVALGQDSLPPLPSMVMRSGETRDFFKREGHGEVIPLAQATFRHLGEDTLCVDLGLKRGPEALSSTFLTFTRITTIEGRNSEERFRVPYDKKARIKEEDFIVETGCTPSPQRNPHAEDDRLQVRVRRPGRVPNVFYINYPESGAKYAMNIFSHSNGTLSTQNEEVMSEGSGEAVERPEEEEEEKENLFFIGVDDKG